VTDEYIVHIEQTLFSMLISKILIDDSSVSTTPASGALPEADVRKIKQNKEM
jgi:hypothetical protein